MRWSQRRDGAQAKASRLARIPLWIPALLLTGCPLDPLSIPGGAGGGTITSTITGCGSAMSADCDDGNPCTVDACEDGVCSYSFAAAGTPCPDASACNGEETCDGKGICVAGTPQILDDGDTCTLDLCDPKTGGVTHPTSPACGAWEAVATAGAPFARTDHTAVWTGAEMIVWGGTVDKANDASGVTSTGGRYDPVAKKWTATSTANAPPPRHSHQAVWTGSKMIVWGGYGAAGYETTGGVYDPATDTWAAMTTTGAPQGRVQFPLVWTGAKAIVWGGLNQVPLGTGAAYDPAADTWTQLAAGPAIRFDHSAIWTGSQMVVWGGNDLLDWHQDGSFYDPSQDAWTGATSTTDQPARREGHSALWTGAEMLVWGGFDGGTYLDSGASFDPASGAGGTWTAMTTTGAPTPRWKNVAVWAGSQMMVWGGCGGDSCFTTLGDGALWIPGAGGGSWKPIATGKVASARINAAAVWTGTEVIVWGGKAGSTGKLLGDGAQSTP
ncbi:MAG: hypothetical protein U0441_01440 [Polyangiaceae bacterium]